MIEPEMRMDDGRIIRDRLNDEIAYCQGCGYKFDLVRRDWFKIGVYHLDVCQRFKE